MGKLLLVVAVLVIAAAALFVLAGRAPAPTLEIVKPETLVGTLGELDVVVDVPGGRLNALDIELEQQGRRTVLFSLDSPGPAKLTQESASRMRVTRGIGKQDLPDLEAGPARIVARAARSVLFGLRTRDATAVHDVQVRLEPPRITVLSTQHYVNHGGSEMVVYRVVPPEVDSGVRVGEVAYPGYPATGAALLAGGEIAGLRDPAVKVAFFALLYDQDLNTPVAVYAHDAVGNAARVALDHRVIARRFARSRIELEDQFMQRVVPAILERTPELRARAGDADLLQQYLLINGELRRTNAAQIAGIASEMASELLWQGPFQQLSNSKVESPFADHRTYFYRGREVDRQVHLGFDLAVTANVAVVAANRGRVVYADYLGIYGNTAVLDHGLGIQSLYAHLSSIDVRVGDLIEQGQPIGRSGMTGLAGGDHLHFTMLVHGHMVTPVDWWDPHWIQDRLVRKLLALGPGSS